MDIRIATGKITQTRSSFAPTAPVSASRAIAAGRINALKHTAASVSKVGLAKQAITAKQVKIGAYKPTF